jgi:hypothetical protein
MPIRLVVQKLHVDSPSHAGEMWGLRRRSDGKVVAADRPAVDLCVGDVVYMDLLGGEILYIKDAKGIVKYDWGQVKEDSP